MNKYNWEKINYPSKIDDCKRFEKCIPTIPLNTLYTREILCILSACISNHNSTREKKLLMIQNKEKEV